MASKIDANCTLKPCDRQGKSNFLILIFLLETTLFPLGQDFKFKPWS